ncbi:MULTISPECIES: oligosaccharide flippase family protein [unclassified Photobacterium]|uniref:oligosaccharide flippase family protein n=1 Tax=unclassified Photobacterium TaxID=2628852 RepID=UPI001EDF8434|nr:MULTISPECIES: oligosaccharide flippase family protein [unclassified Photobacterium]MCG3864913.1 oligosaccharide flippase family protein [Photobacterium sp. Ph6]MCG3876321.1 oligosaccharide flippase family protein [Photobacterium sp. Ph5]
MYRLLLKVISSSGGGVIVNILLYPFIINIFSPMEYGEFSLFLVPLTIVVVFANFKMDLVIVSANKQDLTRMFRLSIIFALYVSIVGAALSVIYYKMIGVDDLFKIYLLSNVYVFSYVVIQLATAFYIRADKIGIASLLLFYQSSAIGVFQLILSMTSLRTDALVYGSVLAPFSALIIILIFERDIRGCFKVKFSDAIKEVRYNKDITYYATGQNIINSLSVSLVLIIINYIGGTNIAGVYSLASKILVIPCRVVSSAVRQTFTSYLSGFDIKIQIKKVYKLSIFIFLISTLIYLAVLLSLNFGILEYLNVDPKWLKINEFSIYISIWLVAVVGCSPFISLMTVYKNNKQYMKFEIVNLFTRILIGMMIIFLGFGYNDYIIVVNILGAIFYMLLSIAIVRKIENENS